MDVSRQEEIIAGIWAICAVVAFGFGFDTWGGVFAGKAAIDTLCAILYGYKEAKIERKKLLEAQGGGDGT